MNTNCRNRTPHQVNRNLVLVQDEPHFSSVPPHTCELIAQGHSSLKDMGFCLAAHSLDATFLSILAPPDLPSVDCADLVGDASRRRRPSPSCRTWLAPPTRCPHPDPAFESAGSTLVAPIRERTARGTGSGWSRLSANSVDRVQQELQVSVFHSRLASAAADFHGNGDGV